MTCTEYRDSLNFYSKILHDNMERLALIRLDLYPFILIKVHKTGYALRMRPQKNRITMSIAKI